MPHMELPIGNTVHVTVFARAQGHALKTLCKKTVRKKKGEHDKKIVFRCSTCFSSAENGAHVQPLYFFSTAGRARSRKIKQARV